MTCDRQRRLSAQQNATAHAQENPGRDDLLQPYGVLQQGACAARPQCAAQSCTDTGPAVHWPRRCTSAVGFSSPESKARGRPERPFVCASDTHAPFTAARVGEPSGSPVPCFRSANPALGRHPRLAAWMATLTHKQGATPWLVLFWARGRPASSSFRTRDTFRPSGIRHCRRAWRPWTEAATSHRISLPSRRSIKEVSHER